MFERKSIKRASSTIEVALAIVMALLVLYLVLNLFSGNIQTVVKNSGLYKVTHKDNADKKTANIAMDTDPTKTQINVQIVADQGSLAQYHNDAAATIERYATESKTETLTDENIQNLALQLTIFAESGSAGTLVKDLLKTPLPDGTTYKDFGSSNGIEITDDPSRSRSKTIVEKNGNLSWKVVYWGTQYKPNTTQEYNPDGAVYSNTTDLRLRVKNIEGIKRCFQEQYKL